MKRLPSLSFAIAIFAVWGSSSAAQTSQQPANLDQVVIESFQSIHDGWSSDEVILNDDLNQAFVDQCQKRLPQVNASTLNWRLINLRKAGKLKVRATKSNRTSVVDVAHIAEIAARTLHDRYSVSTDQIMTQTQRRAEFNQIAKSIAPDVDLYRVRKSAFQLRKARKLRPELITRIADWGRVVESFSVDQLRQNPDLVPRRPGIYIFRDATGYLYIGQTEDLHERLKTHLEHSHNESLSAYLAGQTNRKVMVEVHSFDAESRAKETRVRRAYESELIASRKPRFNIQP